MQHLSLKPLLLLTSLLLAACAHPQRTLVVTVGGAGFSQMHDLRIALEEQCPDAKVISAGMWDAYKTDLAKLATDKPRDHIIFIGHSFGCRAIDDAADELPGGKVDLAVFIDPAWSDFNLSPHIKDYLWFKRSSFDVIRESKIIGAGNPQKIPGGHNDIPHSPLLISQVVAEVQRISRQPQAGSNQKPAQFTRR